MTYFTAQTNDLNNGTSDAILPNDLLICESITPEQLSKAKDIEVVIDHREKGKLIRKAQNGFFTSYDPNDQKEKISPEALNFAYEIVEIQRSCYRGS